MWRKGKLSRIATAVLFVALALWQVMPVLAQSEDGVSPDGADPGAAAVETGTPAAETKEGAAAGESSSIDTGKSYMYLPLALTGDAAQANAAAPAASWVTVFYDELCAYPSGWARYDAGGTGHAWVYQTVDGWCTMRPNGNTHRMNVTTYRTFSLAGALSARATFRFRMSTEQSYDFLRVEYSCNSGKTWWGNPSAYSGAYGWSTATVSLNNCLGATSVRLRFSFQTDPSVLSGFAPAVDYVRVQKYW